MLHDPHKILGIGRDASDEQIRKAYKALVMRWHPDRNIQNCAEAERMIREVRILTCSHKAVL